MIILISVVVVLLLPFLLNSLMRTAFWSFLAVSCLFQRGWKGFSYAVLCVGTNSLVAFVLLSFIIFLGGFV